MNTVQELAESFLKHFEQKTRDNGDTFYCLKDDAPEALQDLVREAHGRMFPDDYKYEFIHDALIAISENDDAENAVSELEEDCYNSGLLRWLASHHERETYVNNAVGEYGHSDGGILGDIGQGQRMEKQELGHAVLEQLNSILEDMAA